jgi:hypothetical protein
MDLTYEFMVVPFVEIEIRLGTIGKNFDSSIDKKYFEKISDFLETGDFLIVNKNTVEYIHSNKTSKGNLKLITSCDKGCDKTCLILKENISTEDFKLNTSPFDVRFSLNQELNMNSHKDSFDKKEAVIRNKIRKSFINEHFRYDLTIVNENINGITKTKYEIEIELIINKETISWKKCYINDFLECKIYDLINIVEPQEREKFKINLI